MPFNSALYLLFVVITVALFWLLPSKARTGFVFLASVVFYATWGLEFVWVPLLFALIVYAAGKRIQANATATRAWMWLGIGTVTALLVFFKYRVFLSGNLGFFVIHGHGPTNVSNAVAIAFPIGISFYTLEAIAYLIDIRQGRVKAPNFVQLCLFFYFWPNVLSGPMVRARELTPQLTFHKKFEACFVFEGMDRIVWGLVQKNVIANILGIWVDRGFSATDRFAPTTIDGWVLAIAFALQLYYDFSAYTNIAIGAARLIGVGLPENFRYPYHAATPPDFWLRWHMTLSRWVRDYLFFPVNAKWGGSPFPLYLSLVFIMALVGLWHGAGWGFIVWGALHGAYLVIYRVYEVRKSAPDSNTGSSLRKTTIRLVTLVAIVAAWIPFRAATLSKAGTMLASMFFRFSSGRGYSPAFYVCTVLIAVFCAFEPFVIGKLGEMDEEAAAAGGISPYRVMVRPIAYVLGLLLFLVFDQNNTQFIYSQF